MPKLTLVDTGTSVDQEPVVTSAQAASSDLMLSLIKDFLDIQDPKVQSALAELVAAVARVASS